MTIHFNLEVPDVNSGIIAMQQIHALTGITPKYISGYSERSTLEQFSQADYELRKASETKYSHLRIIRKAV